MIDAHNHLHDVRLLPYRREMWRTLPALGVEWAAVNGTRESDWAAVAQLAREQTWVRPSFGLHPWFVPERSSGWQETLLLRLAEHPGCGLGEIGLDRWVQGHDLAQQRDCFTWQLQQAVEQNLPTTIHCLQAWGPLWEILSCRPLPARGFLLHAYGGPREMVHDFIRLGARFSFSPSFLDERKAAQRAIFAELPADRLLVETDAPDLAPPAEVNPRKLTDPAGRALNHPANLELAYTACAELRGCTRAELETQTRANFLDWFGPVRSAD